MRRLLALSGCRAASGAGLLITLPGIRLRFPGSFENALDWLVGSETFPGKPVALINTSLRASAAQAALRLVLTTMAARVIDEASITVDLLSRRLTSEAIAADPSWRLLNSLHELVADNTVCA